MLFQPAHLYPRHVYFILIYFVSINCSTCCSLIYASAFSSMKLSKEEKKREGERERESGRKPERKSTRWHSYKTFTLPRGNCHSNSIFFVREFSETKINIRPTYRKRKTTNSLLGSQFQRHSFWHVSRQTAAMKCSRGTRLFQTNYLYTYAT